MNRLRHFILFIFITPFFSCNRNSSGKALTKEQQATFTRFIKKHPTPDIKNFHYFPDEMGIDASYWISFECADSTVNTISEKLELQQAKWVDEGLIGGLNIQPTAWWDTAFIRKEKPYSRQKENIYWYLWYDKNKKKVYFLTFDT